MIIMEKSFRQNILIFLRLKKQQLWYFPKNCQWEEVGT